MEGSKFGGPRIVSCLVALEMNPMYGGQWGSILLSGQWKVPSLEVNGEAFCLVANGRFQA